MSQYDYHNPFAWALNSTNNVTDKILTTVNSIQYINGLLTTMFGYSFNVLLFSLVLFRTPTVLKPFSKLLIVCCVTDFLFITIDEICQIVSFNNTVVHL